MKLSRGTVAGATALLLLTGCGGGEAAPNAQPTVTVTVTPTPLEATELSDPTPSAGSFEPNVGERALKIGEPRQGSAVRTTLREVRFPYPPGQYREPEQGQQFVGLRIEQCLAKTAEATDDYGDPIQSTYPGDWYVGTPNGNQLTGGGEWTDWPQPKFPTLVSMNPGECLKGWITLEVPVGTKIAKLIWRPGGTTTAEWLP
jgi:hypothetical protein